MRQDGLGTCQDCSHEFPYYLIHNGFNDTSYAYCDTCGMTAVLSAYNYPSGAPFEPFQQISSGMEPYLKRCPCGGRFAAGASPRCSACCTLLSATAAARWIETNAPGTRRGWRWQRSWHGLYCIVLEERVVFDPWVAGGDADAIAMDNPKQFPCPCCGFQTLDEETPGSFDICTVCGWEDDKVQFDNPDFTGGANTMSLNEAKKAYHEGRRVD